MASKTVKKMTITVSSVRPGGLRGQKVVEATARGYTVKFDHIGDLFEVAEGDKILIEIRESPPANLEGYIFCGHGYLASKPTDPFTILSIWGILFRFEPAINLEPDKKYYICLQKKK